MTLLSSELTFTTLLQVYTVITVHPRWSKTLTPPEEFFRFNGLCTHGLRDKLSNAHAQFALGPLRGVRANRAGARYRHWTRSKSRVTVKRQLQIT